MGGKYKLYVIQFVISMAAYLIVFLLVCISIGLAENKLMIFNGVFFIIYILSLWKTGMDTFEFYDSAYFIVDMLSVAIYANIPLTFVICKSQEDFVCRGLILIALNESVCVIWDLLCHEKSKDEQGKGFHLKWTILTFIGIFGMVISVLLVKFNNSFSTNVLVYIADILNILYQFVLLIYWWVSEYFIKRRNTFSRK